MIRKKINSDNENFIGCWNINNPELCKDIIDFFENNTQLHIKGNVTSGENNIKKTTDITIFPNDLMISYLLFSTSCSFVMSTV